MFCNSCGRRNQLASICCSSCGAQLDTPDDQTTAIANVSAVREVLSADDATVDLGKALSGVPSLIVRSGPQAGMRFPLHETVTRLGRQPDSEIILDDVTVSRHHADIRHTPKGYVVSDNGSLNGTYVNQGRIENAKLLAHGDELQVGKFRLVFTHASQRNV